MMIRIDELVKCDKEIINKRRPEFKIDQAHKKLNLPLQCLDGSNNNMTMFIRRLLAFPEDFTIGLRLDTPNNLAEFAMVLVRFQGPHGGQSEKRDIKDLHNSYHIHYYSQEDYNRRKRVASIDNKRLANFSSFEEAVCQFLGYCNIKDPNGLFNLERDSLSQLRLNL